MSTDGDCADVTISTVTSIGAGGAGITTGVPSEGGVLAAGVTGTAGAGSASTDVVPEEDTTGTDFRLLANWSETSLSISSLSST